MSDDNSHTETDDLSALHKFLVENTVSAAKRLNQLRKAPDQRAQEGFKSSVDGLTQFYFYKYKKTDVEKPELFQKNTTPPNMISKDLSKCKKIYFSIRQVQDELGHTTLENIKPGRRNL